MAINNNQVLQNKLNILIHTISRFWYFVTFCLTWCKLSNFDLFQHFVPCLFNTMLSSNIFSHFICTMLKFWSFAMVFYYDLGYDFEIWSSIITHKNTSAQNIDIVRFIKHFVVELCVWYGILIILKCAWLVWLMWDNKLRITVYGWAKRNDILNCGICRVYSVTMHYNLCLGVELSSSVFFLYMLVGHNASTQKENCNFTNTWMRSINFLWGPKWVEFLSFSTWTQLAILGATYNGWRWIRLHHNTKNFLHI